MHIGMPSRKSYERCWIVASSSDPGASGLPQIVLIKKKEGSLRLCVDYRWMNAASRVDAYPMPRIDNLIDRLGAAKYITTLDLTRGYWQVPVAKEDQHKTAFITPFGLFQFRVMPFGLCGAPATFQRMMDRLIEGLEDFTAAYLDDLVIHSDNWAEHLQHIQCVLHKLQEAGLTAKPAKCQIAMAQCTYLGQIVGGGKVCPETDKLEAVKGFPVSITKKQVRSFLGFTGYYRRFMPDCIHCRTINRSNQEISPQPGEVEQQLQQSFREAQDAAVFQTHPMEPGLY